MKFIDFCLVVSAGLVSACGGGNYEVPQDNSKLAAYNAPVCLSGNSVMRGSYILPNGEIRRSQFTPEAVVGWYYPTLDYSVNGSSVASMRAVNNWVPPSCTVHAILHYHNDNPATFENQLHSAISEMTAPIKMVVIANLPTPPVRTEWANIEANANIARSVAAARGVYLCDANMGFSENSSDGLHPNDEGFATLSGKLVKCINNAVNQQ